MMGVFLGGASDQSDQSDLSDSSDLLGLSDLPGLSDRLGGSGLVPCWLSLRVDLFLEEGENAAAQVVEAFEKGFELLCYA